MNSAEVANVLSATAIVLSGTSLGWQAWTRRNDGPVVNVQASQALPAYEGRAGDWHVNVTAINTGGSTTTVTGWGFRFPDKSTLVATSPPSWSTKLPHQLNARSHAEWFLATAEVKETCAQHGARHQDLVAFVRLADGSVVTAKRPGIGLK